MRNVIYKVCPSAEWLAAQKSGIYTGSADDKRDGFIHFSSADQLATTLAKHFAGQKDLVLISVDAMALGDGLKWEASRGGDLFPHLYGPLKVCDAQKVEDLPLAADGHVVPDLEVV